jgi:hypothetical protein
MQYIRRVRVESPGSRNEHITDVQHSSTPAGTLAQATKQTMVNLIDAGTSVRSHNDATGAEAAVVTRMGSSGLKYIATVADGKESNNLLALPRF